MVKRAVVSSVLELSGLTSDTYRNIRTFSLVPSFKLSSILDAILLFMSLLGHMDTQGISVKDNRGNLRGISNKIYTQYIRCSL